MSYKNQYSAYSVEHYEEMPPGPPSFDSIDTDGSGSIDKGEFTDFSNAMQQKLQQRRRQTMKVVPGDNPNMDQESRQNQAQQQEFESLFNKYNKLFETLDIEYNTNIEDANNNIDEIRNAYEKAMQDLDSDYNAQIENALKDREDIEKNHETNMQNLNKDREAEEKAIAKKYGLRM